MSRRKDDITPEHLDGAVDDAAVESADNATDTVPDTKPMPDAAGRRRFPPLRIAAAVFAVVGVAALVVLLAFGLINRSPVTGRSGVTRIDKPAPNMSMPLYGGGMMTAVDYAGKPTVVNFWASWCGPCRQEAPIFERLSQEYGERGVLFIGVNIQDAEADAEAYLREFGITYPNGRDADGSISVDYGVIGIPVTFFVSRDGIVQRRWAGVMRETQLRHWIDELVAGAEPTGDTQGENPEGYEPLR